jgi:hypothetical protein
MERIMGMEIWNTTLPRDRNDVAQSEEDGERHEPVLERQPQAERSEEGEYPADGEAGDETLDPRAPAQRHPVHDLYSTQIPKKSHHQCK